MPKLSSVFAGVVYKFLSPVDVDPSRSNQHEITSTKAMQNLLGNLNASKISATVRVFLPRGNITAPIELTHYDARAKSATRTGRSEWRLYYRGDALEGLEANDLLLIAKLVNDEILMIGVSKRCLMYKSVRKLFSISDHPLSSRVLAVPQKTITQEEIDLVSGKLIHGIIAADEDSNDSGAKARKIIHDHGGMPDTRTMAAFAWELSTFTRESNADNLLCEFLENETDLFFSIEREIILPQITKGIGTVERLIEISMSAIQRRKARRGLSLEIHLEKIFDLFGLSFDTQQKTEGKYKPDFIFPSINAYRDPTFPDDQLFMLAAKSTCKDRWRQILTEADRISTKHLCTLEEEISRDQTEQMKSQNVVLVVPRPYQCHFKSEQLKDIKTLQEFIDTVGSSQKFP